jgi:GGDEF domain-containing protein
MDERVIDELNGTTPDYRADLGAAVAAYLSTLQAVSACVAESSSDVGQPYGARIQKLQARLAFNPTRDAIRDSAEVVRGELMNFASLSAMRFEQHALEFEHSTSSVQHLLHTMVRRSEFFLSKLRQTAEGLSTTPYPADAAQWQGTAAQLSASLLQLAESLSRETASHVQAIEEELHSASERLGDFHASDEATGLMTREEALRRIEALRADEVMHTPLVFDLSERLNAASLRQIAAKLSAHFRHQDLIARWSDQQFMVVFHGDQRLAETRSAQVLPSLNGEYLSEDGQITKVQVDVRVEHMVTATL